ncbi:MAG: hypothetical protein NTX11_00570 [Candidatus Saccharibacteria bacterium]|nr:hypothetical protein [Candidatus Saccharibacteria bacterium]
MSETPPTASGQMDGEQFDAEVAQKAKAMLDEGVDRKGDEGVEASMLARPGEIVDTEGNPLPAMAANYYRNHGTHEDEKTSQLLRKGKLVRSFDAAKETSDELHAQVSPLSNYGKRELQQAQEAMDDIRRPLDESMDAIEDATTKSSANLWDAQQHLKQNRAGYEAAAIEDANAAGHDITLNGQVYPAQQPPAPEQPNQNVA